MSDWIDAALEQAKLEAPRRWDPEEGDYLGGTIVNLGSYRSRHGDDEERPLIDIQVERGTLGGSELEAGSVWRVNCGVGALMRWIERDDPQRHDRVVVLYEGADGPHPNSRRRYLAKVAR